MKNKKRKKFTKAEEKRLLDLVERIASENYISSDVRKTFKMIFTLTN